MKKLLPLFLFLATACNDNKSITPETTTDEWNKAFEAATIDQIYGIASDADHLYLLTTSFEGDGHTFFNIDKDNNIVEKRSTPFFNVNGYYTLTQDFYAIAGFSSATQSSLISFYSLEPGKTEPISIVDANEFMPDVNHNLSVGADVLFSPIRNSDGSYWMLLVRTNHTTNEQDMGVARFTVNDNGVTILTTANISSQSAPNPHGLYSYKDKLLFTSKNTLSIVNPDGTVNESVAPGGDNTVVSYITIDNTLLASYANGDRFYTTDLINWTKVNVNNNNATHLNAEGAPILMDGRLVATVGNSLNIYNTRLDAGTIELITTKEGPKDVSGIQNIFEFNGKLYLFTKPAFYVEPESDLLNN